MKDKRHIQSFNEHQENLNISDVSDSDDIQDMSLEEKLLRFQFKIHELDINKLSMLELECIIGAMKEVSLQRKLGNWTNKVK